ncbi:hypothetical protein EU546_05255 [Candidatus Thorarchaeota archaeon]|nr:MAG: hypothetical protein EU546_05255 [Candidatus Thorarchaeota archaeon]
MRRCEFCDSPVAADATVCPVCKETIAEETLERILPMLKRPEAPEVHFMGTGERLWGVIRKPSATYRDIGKRPDMVGPFVVILLNALVIAGLFLAMSSKVTTFVVVNSTSGQTANMNLLLSPQGGIFIGTALVGILANVMLGFVYLLVGAAFAHFAFKITGGTGSKGKTMSIIGYSMLPVVLVRVVAILVVLIGMPAYPDIVNFLNQGALNAVTPALISWAYTSGIWYIVDVLTTGGFVWVGFVLIFGIREAHNTSTLWAFVISLLCIIIFGWTFWQAH